jgi:hypothetical protein
MVGAGAGGIGAAAPTPRPGGGCAGAGFVSTEVHEDEACPPNPGGNETPRGTCD